MGQLQDAFMDAAGEVANIKAQPSNRYWWLYGTIKAKNENGTLDVAIDGVTIQQVKATVSCMMANVGDRVIVLKAGPLMTCVDVIAKSDEVVVPVESLPTASTTSKGIMQVGSGLTVSDGLVSVDNWAYIKKLVESSTWWTYLWQSSSSAGDYVRWRMLMGVVYLEVCHVKGVDAEGWKCGTLPASARLPYDLYHPMASYRYDHTAAAWVGGSNGTNPGEVWLYNNGSSYMYGMASWPVDL